MTEISIDGRIDAWLAAGLIDAATAAALRADEAARTTAIGPEPNHGRGPGTLAAAFGPSVSIAEVFGYLGGAFILASWIALIGIRGGEVDLILSIGLLMGAAALAGIGLAARRRSERFRRAAGVCFLGAGAHVGAAAYAAAVVALGPAGSTEPPVAALAGATAWLIAAIGFRRLHPALMTQLGLIGAVLAFTGATMSWLEPILFGDPFAGPEPAPADILRPILIAVGWAISGVVLGVIGLTESRSGLDGAGSRAALTRFAAGMTVILGTATAVFASGPLPNDGYGRLIPPIVGDLILIVVSGILLERAARRSANAFLYPAALGIVIAATDLNAEFLGATSPALALLVEGAILLGAGLAADRFRRRVARAAQPTEAAAPSG